MMILFHLAHLGRENLTQVSESIGEESSRSIIGGVYWIDEDVLSLDFPEDSLPYERFRGLICTY